MGVTEYLWQLALGTSSTEGAAQTANTLSPELEQARQKQEEILKAENDILATIGFYNSYDELEESAENLLGFGLAVGSLASNWVLSYPFIIIRNRHQIFPRATHPANPLEALSYLNHRQQAYGLLSLYPGFGLTLVTQAATLSHDSFQSNLHSRLEPYLKSLPTFPKLLILGGLKCFHVLTYSPLYALHRTALLLRISDPPFKRFSSVAQIWKMYLGTMRGLFWEPGRLKRTIWALSPPVILHHVSEQIQPRLYRTFSKAILPNHRRRPRKHEQEPMLHGFYAELVCALASHLVTKLLLFPLDTIVYRVVAEGPQSEVKGWPLVELVKRMWIKEGLKAFYEGVGGGLVGEAIVGWAVLEGTWFVYCGVVEGVAWYFGKKK